MWPNVARPSAPTTRAPNLHPCRALGKTKSDRHPDRRNMAATSDSGSGSVCRATLKRAQLEQMAKLRSARHCAAGCLEIHGAPSKPRLVRRWRRHEKPRLDDQECDEMLRDNATGAHGQSGMLCPVAAETNENISSPSEVARLKDQQPRSPNDNTNSHVDLEAKRWSKMCTAQSARP